MQLQIEERSVLHVEEFRVFSGNGTWRLDRTMSFK